MSACADCAGRHGSYLFFEDPSNSVFSERINNISLPLYSVFKIVNHWLAVK